MLPSSNPFCCLDWRRGLWRPVSSVCWGVSTIGRRSGFWGIFHGGGRMGRGSNPLWEERCRRMGSSRSRHTSTGGIIKWRSKLLRTPFWTYSWIRRGGWGHGYQIGGGIRRAWYSQGDRWRGQGHWYGRIQMRRWRRGKKWGCGGGGGRHDSGVWVGDQSKSWYFLATHKP